VATSLESYLLRRAVLGWTTKAYNRIFLNATKALRQEGPTPQSLVTFLSQLQGDSAAWPTDEVFPEAWQGPPAYEELNNAKLVHLMQRLSESYLTNLNEPITIDGPLTLEHILPQNWIEQWPLSSGEQGMTSNELWDADSNDSRAVATRLRNSALQ